MRPRSPEAPIWLEYEEEDMTPEEAQDDYYAHRIEVDMRRLADAQERIRHHFEAPPGMWLDFEGPIIAEDVKTVGPAFMQQYTHPVFVHAPVRVSTMEAIKAWVLNLFSEA